MLKKLPEKKSDDYLGDMDLPPSDDEMEVEADDTERREVDLTKMVRASREGSLEVLTGVLEGNSRFVRFSGKPIWEFRGVTEHSSSSDGACW